MTVGRVGATAAPLADGRVLVAGGVDPSNGFAVLTVLKSAEIFDPATGSFSPTGSMRIPRVDAAAAPLPDGRVLVAGGDDGTQLTGALKSAEIFDPATGTFSPTGDMTALRDGPAAAPLPDGRVLVAGGDYDDLNSHLHRYLASAEIFDPRTGTFSPTGSMTVPRTSAAAAAPLPNGEVLVAGGDVVPPRASAEIFDAPTGKFAPTGNMTEGRASAAAAPLPDGRVLVAGGGYLGLSAEIFDPLTATFAPTGQMTTPRYGPAVAPLSDGRVLVAGTTIGLGPTGLDVTRSAELFTPDLSYRLDGRKLIVPVAVAGTLTAADATPGAGGSATAAGKRRLLKPTSARGGPRRIILKLRPTASGKRRLERKGKLKIRARLRFAPAPVSGECVTAFSPCYSRGYAIRETLTLRLKAKKRN